MTGLPAFIANILGSLAGFFFQYMSKKAAITTTVVVAFLALVTALYGVIIGLLAGIVAACDGTVYQYIGYAIPNNLAICVTTSVTARTAKWVYGLNIKLLDFWANTAV